MQNQNVFNEELLKTDELCERIKYKRQSIYNLICKGEFIHNVHFLKPSSRKLLFKWPAIYDWLENKSFKPISIKDASKSKKKNRNIDGNNKSKNNCRIKI